jgi:alkanesulfonate monooxygenase SsuD/methylene tetrahydromethanopterin reductase-like flavin-dependent oxidoreductase (luciferase family)
MKYGLLLPHFGPNASGERVLVGARLAEDLGFDSLWVRDHLVFEPHSEMEDASPVFYEALATLTAAGAVTSRITLGTGSLIPFRHPIHTALAVASLTRLVGPRVIVGFGAGTFDHEFEAVGMSGIYRPELVESNARILKRLVTEDDVDYEDAHYVLKAITVEPKPPAEVPFWYCGATPASARRAVEYCDGWMPGRITLSTIERRVAMMKKLAADAGRSVPTVGVIPPTSIARSHEDAYDGLNIDGLLRWANERGKWWVKPPSGRFETAADIEGSLIAGTPEEVVEQVTRFDEVGVEHLVFDLRLRFEHWFDSLELLGTRVLPELRAAGLGG